MRQPPERAPVDAYRELFERSADAILIIEGEMFIDCNQAAVDMLRSANREQLLRTHPSELSPPLQADGRASYEKANEMIALAFERGSHRFEWAHRRMDGEVFPVEVLLTAVQEPGRRVLHVVWRDITDRKLLEEQLRHSQRLEAIGKLSGGIAHDFNNLLAVVLGHAELLSFQLAHQPRALRHVQTIQRSGKQAAGLVRQLLAFGRKQQLRPGALELNQLLEDLLPLMEPLVGRDHRVELRSTDEAVHVVADRGQLEQVLLNLASNARDAMPGGGAVVIEAGRVWRDDVRTAAGDLVPAGEYARIRVTDAGVGMPPEVLEHAFEPFFTTKEVGEGTGLGLATVYGVVRQSGGEVELSSTPGVGTTVAVFLPITDARPEGARPAPADSPVVVGDESVLVVEDDDAVAELVVQVLTGAGYRARRARDGREALALFQRDASPCDLLLSDVVMAGMGGPELVSRLLEMGLRPRVLFMSGYTNDALTALYQRHSNVHLVDKPFSRRELLRRVRLALDGA